ncbi:hypothetical protein NQ318_020382 [Aromia moschata]|uniref:Uncharacterized protein n=1 Tax=Aromia moschata TaxID=1265417 RepID=A0AAV8Y275_9CUCU|nr:hypothetical protein NQ318_020382 [Aromia moschata]
MLLKRKKKPFMALGLTGIAKKQNRCLSSMAVGGMGIFASFIIETIPTASKRPTDTLNYRYENTVNKMTRLKSLGYHVVEMWECEFRKRPKENPDTQNPCREPFSVKIRSFKSTRLVLWGTHRHIYEYYKIKYGENINYIDVCSLYPWRPILLYQTQLSSDVSHEALDGI